jgi:hypothetical protein
MNLQLPDQFNEILEQNPALVGQVKLSISEFSPWLGRNSVKFFTEYTDHSLKHVEDVLQEANDLIREECRAIVSPADIATLCSGPKNLDSFLGVC